MAAAELLCPECGTPYEKGDFQCTGCELILDLDAAGADYRPNEPGIVRALLSPPQRRSGVKPRPPPGIKKKGDPEMTVRATVVMDEFTVPRLVAGMDLALTPLNEFEAMVASFVDGANNVPQIAAAAEISKVEAMAVFTSLAERRVVELRRTEPPRAAPRPPPPPEPKLPDLAALARTQPGLPDEPPPEPPPEPATQAQREPDTLPPNTLPAASPTPPVDLASLFPADLEPPPAPPPRRTPPPSQATPATGTIPSRFGARSAPAPVPKPKPAQIQAPSPYGQAPKAESVLERAISLERRGEVEGAIHILKRAITQVKDPAALCNKLALILVNQRKDFRQAEELLNKAIELEPENAVYQQNLFKIVGMAAERRESGGGKGPGGKGFLSKLLKK